MTVQERVRDHRRRMRARGYRLVQIWVPDVRTPGFVDEAHRQSELMAVNDQETDDEDFVEAISADWGQE
ncbi:antitoxin MazE-like protein [Acidipropionibacterium timonense]|uniref:antitoxin MazE-like protein n=1 Tax=Acidipropionibacterium timonense TaxID=2161818 RepID=UPI00102FEACB|nr:antitoxin MazE-like protein [Acidipropionibacterium timonense]